jgi:hypothetical protein
MNKRNLLAAVSGLLLVVITVVAMMPEEEQMALALKLSEESNQKEQQAVLKPGTYQEYIDIRKTFRAGLPAHSEVPVPFKVYQIAVQNPQHRENVSCGPRVLFIAHAIDSLHKSKRPISANTIAKVLSKNNDYTNAIEECLMQLESDELPTFIKNNNLKIGQYFVMGRNVSNEGVYSIIPYIPQVDLARFEHFEMSLKILGQELEADRINRPIHFIFSDTRKAHWVLVSVIKGENTNPIVYYIDPKNVNISSYPVADNYIEYVVDKLELPFPKK